MKTFIRGCWIEVGTGQLTNNFNEQNNVSFQDYYVAGDKKGKEY